MARRTGQIIDRGQDKWLVRVYLGTDSTGKRRYHNKTIHGRKKDAQAYLNKVLRQKDLGTFVQPSLQTLNEFLDEWLNTVVEERVRQRTLDGYKGKLRCHVRPVLGDTALANVRPIDIQRLYKQMLDDGLSPRTVRYTHFVLNNALDQAVKWNLLARNPAAQVDLPRRVRPDIMVLSPEQVDNFLRAAEHDRYYALFTLAVTTGMRLGELLGLQWGEIDLEHGRITVRQSLVRSGKQWSLSEPKTSSSRRQIALPPSVIPVLRAHRRTQAQERLASEAYDNNDLVFATAGGQPLRRQNLSRRHFKPILKAAGLSDIRFHDLRHTCATLLLLAGENPKVISERLGHSSVAFTLDTYSHVLPNMQQQAADKLEAMLFA